MVAMASPLPPPEATGIAPASPKIARLDDFHLTAAESHFLRGLNRKRRRAIMAAFRHKSLKERQAVVGRLKAEYAQAQARADAIAKANRKATGET